MLVYIRKNNIKDVLCPVTDNDIPEQLMLRLTEERKLEAYRRKERLVPFINLMFHQLHYQFILYLNFVENVFQFF